MYDRSIVLRYTQKSLFTADLKTRRSSSRHYISVRLKVREVKIGQRSNKNRTALKIVRTRHLSEVRRSSKNPLAPRTRALITI